MSPVGDIRLVFRVALAIMQRHSLEAFYLVLNPHAWAGLEGAEQQMFGAWQLRPHQPDHLPTTLFKSTASAIAA